jgi:hypothetical protein
MSAPVLPAARLPMLGCMTAVAIALAGCGSGDKAATANFTAAKAAGGQAGTKAASESCPSQLHGFVKSLDSLRRRLAVGLSYEQYAAEMRDLKASYDAIPIDRLTIACLARAGTPGEKAFNRYIDAANAWGECLADASCATASIEPVLQRRWRIASGFLSAAR